tara:strand:- start:171 stop:2090 length:1920 start_codon:yes stop_codon:yes gene_type:complete
MSGFGYVRDSKPVVTDWAQVGRDMGKVITDEFTDREARKADIEKQSAEIAKNLLDSPVGQYEEANRFVSDFSSQAQQQALADLRLLKNNQISEREYYNRRANLKSGTDLMFTAVQKFNENYDTAMQNILDGKSSVLLSDLKGEMEGYLNFAKNGTFINPATASVNVSRLRDGVASSDPSDFINAGMLLKLSTADFKNADLDKKIKSVQERLGSIKYTDASGRTQSISLFDLNLLSDIEKNKLMQSKDFTSNLKNALEDEVEAIVGNVNSNNAASILADYSGEKYSLSFDPKLFNEKGELINPKAKTNEIAYSPNGQVTLTDGQLEKAKELVRKKLQRGLDFSSTQRPANYFDRQTSRTDKEAQLSYELAYDLTLGGKKAENNKQIILANNDELRDINETEDTWVIEYKDNRPDKIIDKIKTKVDGVDTYDRESTAEALYTVVDPNSTPVKSQKARRDYFRSRSVKNPISTDLLVSTREATPVANTTSYYTNQEILKGNKAITINQQVENITDLDEDSAPKIESIIRGIQTLPGAENFFDEITVKPSPEITGDREDIRVILPENLAALLKDKNFVTKSGNDFVDITVEGAIGGISEEEGRSNLNQFLDFLIAEMTKVHNANKGVKPTTQQSGNKTGGTSR